MGTRSIGTRSSEFLGKWLKPVQKIQPGSECVAGDKVAHLEGEVGGVAHLGHEVDRDGEQDGNGHREPSGGVVERKRLEFLDKQLDALLDVDDADVEAERLRSHVGDEAGKVAHIEDGDDEVEARSPDERPRLDTEVVRRSIRSSQQRCCTGVVDEVDQTGDADKGEWLDGEDGEDDGGQGRRQRRG